MNDNKYIFVVFENLYYYSRYTMEFYLYSRVADELGYFTNADDAISAARAYYQSNNLSPDVYAESDELQNLVDNLDNWKDNGAIVFDCDFDENNCVSGNIHILPIKVGSLDNIPKLDF